MKYPILDNRRFDNLIQAVKKLAPNFTHEWKFSEENPDVGSALFMIVALQLEESIDLLNKSLYNNFIEYLNYLNISLNPPKTARVPMVISLSEGFTGSIQLPKETKLIGKNNKLNKTVSFETENSLEVVSTKILNMVLCSGFKDTLEKVKGDKKHIICFGDSGENIQEHIMYISNEAILICSEPREFEVIFAGATQTQLETLAKEEYVKWMYFSEEGWKAFDAISTSDKGIILIKNNELKIAKNDFQGCKGIKCSVNSNRISYLQDCFIDNLYMKSKLLNEEKYSEKLRFYYNDKILENQDFLPFGLFFNQYDNFYISSEEVFSKKGAEIEIIFDLEVLKNKIYTIDKKIDWKPIMKASELEDNTIETLVSIKIVKWQYWNGTAWRNLEIDRGFEEIFYCKKIMKSNKVKFICPSDIASTLINGDEAYFIRLSVERVENAFGVNGTFVSPKLNNVQLSFNYEKEATPQKIIIENNIMLETIVPNNFDKFRFFKGLEYNGNAIYLQFDKSLENAAVNLLFIIEKTNNEFIYNKKIQFQYLAKDKEKYYWKEKKVLDETKGLTQSGIISLQELDNFMELELFGEKGYWIRFVFDEQDNIQRLIKSIYVNGVWAIQQTSINNEFIDISNEKEIFLSQNNVIDIELWVNEIETLGKTEISKILSENSLEYKVTYDTLGILKELWIKWRPVEHFYHLKPEDRVYNIEFLTGKLKFGDGIRGKLLPFNKKKILYANYKVGGGEQGNVEVGEIKQMESPIAFIDKVYNPEKGEGGTGTELLEKAVERGIKKIRHRNRGVTVRDLEDLTKDVSNDIYAAKCITNVNCFMEEEIGALNLVVLLKADISEGMSYNLKVQIENYLRERIPYNLVVTNKLYISDAEMLKMNLNVNIKMEKNYSRATVINNIKRNIKNFLDYKTGNYNGEGWGIGEIPRESFFYSIISEQEAVLNVNSVAISLYKVKGNQVEEVTFSVASKMQNIIIISGEHNINIIDS